MRSLSNQQSTDGPYALANCTFPFPAPRKDLREPCGRRERSAKLIFGVGLGITEFHLQPHLSTLHPIFIDFGISPTFKTRNHEASRVSVTARYSLSLVSDCPVISFISPLARPLFNMATDLCISVLKFSYATGQRSDNTIPWAKVAASDLFAIVKSAKDNDRELTMRVVQGNSVLVDLSRPIASAQY